MASINNYLPRIIRFKHTVDFSRVPILLEKDLEEQFVRGSGPGGSNTNKNSNCVVLKHLPSDSTLVKSISYNSIRFKHAVDYSKVPKLLENDLEESFVRGSGPGGQNVNKTSNCVVLKHIPTGLVVKCHQSRLLQDNQKTARKLMITKLDNLINKENSAEAQLKTIEEEKSLKRAQKKQKLKLLKEQWKSSQNPDS